MNDLQRPDGIERRHIHEVGGSGLRTAPVGAAGLGLLLGAAIFGVFGVDDAVSSAGDGAALTVEGPKRIRSGEFFEMLFTIETERELRDAVLRVDEDIWHDVTINTMIPQAAEEGFKDGSFEFHFGALRPGTRLLVKVDGQINPAYPPGNNAGAIVLADAAAEIATIDYSMRVLP
jgi:hypothetical protein